MGYKNFSILIVLIALVLAVTSLWDDSFVVDEVPHVGAGYSYIIKGDYRLNPEHPPLAKDVAGLALSFLPIDQSVFSTKHWTTNINDQWDFGRTLIYSPVNDVDAITRTAKTTMLIFFVLSAVLIYRWTNERYGKKAAFMATILFSFSPTVLAHSRFVTTDMPALFGVLLGTYFFVRFVQKPTRRGFWFTAIAFGIAQLTKFSVVFLVPLLILIVIAWCAANSFSFRSSLVLLTKTLTMMAAGIVLVVWPVYALHTMNYPPEKQRSDTEFNLSSYGNRLFAAPVVWASDKPVIRPLAYYATGILMVNQRSAGGNTTFFLGEVRNYAWKKYFPVVYAIKEPLAFWALAVIILIYLAYLGVQMKFSSPVDNRHRKSFIHSLQNWTKNYFVEFCMLLWIAMYWYLSISANLNIGIRHLLPTYGFIFILLAGQISQILTKLKTKIEKVKTTAKKLKPVFIFSLSFLLFTFYFLLGWYVSETIRIYPYYLTYFNQLALLRPAWATEGRAGGISNGGHLYIVDSNLDWGQDLKRLAMWVEENDIDKIHLDYFGQADKDYYLKDRFVLIKAETYKNSRDFLAKNPNGGYLAVSSSSYMGSRGDPENNYVWLDAYEPVVKVGNSIWVWRITP